VKTAVIITARTGSTRLPRKALAHVYKDVPLIEHVIKRAQKSKNANEIILSTTILQEDDILCSIAKRCGAHVFRGSVEDKLDRWKNTVEKYQIDYFATMDGDDPLCVPELIDKSIEQIISQELDFIESTQVITGLFTYAIRTSALQKVCEIKDSSNTEMMWTYFKDTDLFRVAELKSVPSKLLRKDIRLTLDYPEDLLLFKTIFDSIPGEENIDISQVIDLLSTDSDLKEINYHREKDFIANQQSKTSLKLK